MYVIDHDTLPRATLPGIEHTTLAGGAHGLRALSVWQQAIAAGAATPPHRHDCEEVIVVSAGSGTLHVAGEAHAFGPRSTLVIPRNVDHQIVNTGAVPLELLAAFSCSPVEVHLPDGSPLPLPWAS